MNKRHHTAMAAEFLVMAQLHRLNLQPALTLGNAKSLDILVENRHGKVMKVEVKGGTKGGKFPVGNADYREHSDKVFVLVLFENFDDINDQPTYFVLTAAEVEEKKHVWQNSFAIYYYKRDGGLDSLEKFRDRWDKITGVDARAVGQSRTGSGG